ncbi:hypothetical protein UFOVP732_31 [uncultured Caudovirales phage]|uniref:Uncharacterized protein n=1 Tax=uncultured Caudovirales phage TaxID=2100421 RepID=A0A6J5NQM7_9CAUD|nr:hypothetical protein UFOVP732_31 [uncultured Caudovirales phage]
MRYATLSAGMLLAIIQCFENSGMPVPLDLLVEVDRRGLRVPS